MKMKILVTGATGGLGSKVINLLLQKTDVEHLAVLVRNEKNDLAKQYHIGGVDVRIGDYANAESLKRAFEGIDTLYFISGGNDAQRAIQHKNVVDQAKKSGIKHIVYTSGVRKDESDASPLATLVASHKQTEVFIQSSGMPFTILRHNLYSEVIKMLIGDKTQLLKSKTIFLPAGNGFVSFVPKKDLAEAEVNILLDPSAYVNKILEFNGSEQINFQGIAETISAVINESICYISPEVTTFESEMNKIGLPHPLIDILSTFSKAISVGEFDQISNDLEVILGRKTQSLTDFLQEAYSS